MYKLQYWGSGLEKWLEWREGFYASLDAAKEALLEAKQKNAHVTFIIIETKEVFRL